MVLKEKAKVAAPAAKDVGEKVGAQEGFVFCVSSWQVRACRMPILASV